MALFPRPQQEPNRIMEVMRTARQDPQGTYSMLMRTNPDFARFVSQERGKTPRQIAQEHGINPNIIDLMDMFM